MSPAPKPVVKKEEVETVKVERGTVKKTGQKESKARVKAEYDLPGQTRPTPAEVHLNASLCVSLTPVCQNDPKRKFYASLLEERADSEMARRWSLFPSPLCMHDQ